MRYVANVSEKEAQGVLDFLSKIVGGVDAKIKLEDLSAKIEKETGEKPVIFGAKEDLKSLEDVFINIFKDIAKDELKGKQAPKSKTGVDTPVSKKESKPTIHTYEKNDVLQVTSGQYAGQTGKFIDFVKGMDKVLLQTDEWNRLYVDSKDVSLLRKAIKASPNPVNAHKYEEKEMTFEDDQIIVEFDGNRTTVTLVESGRKGVARCDEEDSFNEQRGVSLAYYRAVQKEFKATEKMLRREKFRVEKDLVSLSKGISECDNIIQNIINN